MATQPLDDDGFVTPHDDRNAIPDESFVVRYIHNDQFHPNESGGRRLSRGAFSASSKDRDRYQGMSVEMLDALNRSAVEVASRLPKDHEGAVIIQAGKLRELGLKIGPDPTPNNNPFHASVWGVRNSFRKKIKSMSNWLIRPEDVSEEL